MSFCACLACLLHDSSFGFCISTSGGSHEVTWTWIVTCCDLLHLGLGRFVGHDQVRRFGFGCPWIASCAMVDCVTVTQIACLAQTTSAIAPFSARLGTGFAK